MSQPSDLVAPIHDLPRRAGEMRPWRCTVAAPPDLGIAMIGVPEGSPVDLDLTLESVVEGIWVSGTADARLVGQCVRCLTQLDEHRRFAIGELYCYPGRAADEDAVFVDNDQIDLDSALRHAVVLELPFSPLCHPDCLGLCPQCGVDLNADPEHAHAEPTDPRWAALQGMVEP